MTDNEFKKHIIDSISEVFGNKSSLMSIREIVIETVNNLVYNNSTSPFANWYDRGPYFRQRRGALLGGTYVNYEDGEIMIESSGMPNQPVVKRSAQVYNNSDGNGEPGFFDMLGEGGHSGFLHRELPIEENVNEAIKNSTEYARLIVRCAELINPYYSEWRKR